MNHKTHLFNSADISIYSPKISKFCYVEKYQYRLHFFWVFKNFINKHGYNFDNVSKKIALGLLKIKISWNKGYDI